MTHLSTRANAAIVLCAFLCCPAVALIHWTLCAAPYTTCALSLMLGYCALSALIIRELTPAMQYAYAHAPQWAHGYLEPLTMHQPWHRSPMHAAAQYVSDTADQYCAPLAQWIDDVASRIARAVNAPDVAVVDVPVIHTPMGERGNRMSHDLNNRRAEVYPAPGADRMDTVDNTPAPTVITPALDTPADAAPAVALTQPTPRPTTLVCAGCGAKATMTTRTGADGIADGHRLPLCSQCGPEDEGLTFAAPAPSPYHYGIDAQDGYDAVDVAMWDAPQPRQVGDTDTPTTETAERTTDTAEVAQSIAETPCKGNDVQRYSRVKSGASYRYTLDTAGAWVINPNARKGGTGKYAKYVPYAGD